jgi:hypothetical protein
MSYNLTIDWQKYETDFRGHKIEMEIRPLKRWASMLLTPLYLEGAETKKNKNKKITSDEANYMYRVQGIGAKILPEHIRNITGININNKTITISDLCEETIFAPLAMDIIAELSRISQLSDNDVKN